MSGERTMTPERALTELAESTAEAVLGVLSMFCPGAAETTGVAVEAPGSDPLAGMSAPLVASSVSYVDGVTGGNVFAIGVPGARALAAAMMGAEPEGEGDLTELELSAVAEAMNQMMAAGAAATGEVLGQPVDISPPTVHTYTVAADVMAAQEEAPHVTRAAFSICGEQARLVQLVPNAFVVRMTRALDEIDAEVADEAASHPETAGDFVAADSLRSVSARVWAELGRTTMAAGEVASLPPGAVVDLDRRADEPVEVLVNGLPFAHGRLIVVDGSEWAVRIDGVGTVSAPADIDTEGGLS